MSNKTATGDENLAAGIGCQIGVEPLVMALVTETLHARLQVAERLLTACWGSHHA
jgi:hypothetical protein